MVKSVYVHIPFCRSICAYCDFCKLYYNEKFANSYLEALEGEVLSRYKNEVIDTLYIGGGTPSSFSLEQLDYLFKILSVIKLSSSSEVTFECNIEDINDEFLKLLKNNNVNRLSIGVQSFNNSLLSILGRSYDFDIYEKILLCKKYFSNINIDLIYSIAGQTLEDLKLDLDCFIKLDINHISIYSLILEDNTMLKVSGYREIDDDQSRGMYDYICKFLKENGFEHYEISNFAKNGTYSRHNLIYWNNLEYYGFGLGASGYLGNVRYTNTKSFTKYLNGNYVMDSCVLSRKEDMENFMMLGLRKTSGVSDKDFYFRYGRNIDDIFNVSKLCYDGDSYFIDENNLYISNYILRDFIDV